MHVAILLLLCSFTALVSHVPAGEASNHDAASYFESGNAKYKRGNYDGAIADYTSAIDLNPKDAPAYFNRGLAKQRKGDLDGALADYTSAIDPNPKDALAYYNRGYLRYDKRAWADALSDFRKASQLVLFQDDEYVRFRIWLIRARLGERDAATHELQAYLAQRRPKALDDWPAKIGAFLTGQLSEEAFLKAAESPDEQTSREQRCKAYFYAGTKRLIDGAKATARRYFEKSLQTGVKTFAEYRSAAAELKFLK